MRSLRLLVPLAFALLSLGCSKEEAPTSPETAAVPDAAGKAPPPMPGGMGPDGRTATPPEGAATSPSATGG